MTITSWLKPLRDRLVGRTSRRPARHSQQLGVQRLEDRAVPATTLSFQDSIRGMAVDSLDNQYVSYDRLHGSVDLDPDPARATWVTGLPLTENGVFGDTRGQFLVKYSPTREVLWVKSPTDFPSMVRGLTISADAGTEYLHVFGEAVTKMDLGGNVVWSVGVSRAVHDYLSNSVRHGFVDADGSFYGSGIFQTSADLDTGTVWADGRDLVSGPTDRSSMYVAKWGADGALQWSRSIHATATSEEATPYVSPEAMYTRAGTIAVADGIVYVGGIFLGQLSLGGLIDSKIETTSSRGDTDGFLAAYDTDGTFRSVAHFVDARLSAVRAVGSDVYVSAQFTRLADMDPGAGQAIVGPNGCAVARLAFDNSNPTPAWTLVWADQFINATDIFVQGLEVSGIDLYVSGAFASTMDFDPSAGTHHLTAGGEQDIFAMKLNAGTGSLEWVSQMGSTPGMYAGQPHETAGLTLTPTGVYLAGYVSHGDVNFVGPTGGAVKIMDAGLDLEAFVAKLDLNGRHQWSFVTGGGGRTIDNGAPGYAESGSGWKGATTGWEGDSRTHGKGNGSNKATWTFTGLPNGTYQVATQFPAAGKNATNAPFRVNGSLATVDQKTWPNDFILASSPGQWENLGTFAVTNGTLTVVLSDAANNTVVADVVRIWLVAPPAPLMAAGGEAAMPVAGPALAARDAQLLLKEALRRWKLAGADVRSLGAIDIQIANLPGATLATASGRTITLDVNAAGHGWFIDRTPRSDSEFTRKGNQGEQNRIDLLTVLIHEIGHLLGHKHDADGVMDAELGVGMRELPSLSARWGVAVTRR